MNDDWRLAAACLGSNPDWWFPVGVSGRAAKANSPRAVKICDRCPVAAECAEYATDNRVAYGIWAGRAAGFWRKRAAERAKRAKTGAPG